MNARRTLALVLKILLPLAVLAGGGFGFVRLMESRVEPERTEAPQRGPLVSAEEAQPRDVPVVIHAYGTVRPAAEIDLTPQVSGMVVELSPSLVSGGFVTAGEVLVRIDPRDYELAVEKSRAEVARATFERVRAEEEAELALQEWQMVRERSAPGSEPGEPDPDGLLLHGPQRRLAEANLAAAQARLKEVELALSRTTLVSPFNARVREESLEVGQYVAAGRSVARLYGTDAAEVVFAVPDQDLRWLGGRSFTGGNGDGPRVLVRAQYAGRDETWQGRIVRTDGVVDPQTRMVPLVAEVRSPYAPGRAPLAVGMFVEGEIQGRTLRGVVSIPRSALREGDTAWVAEDGGILRIRPLEVAHLSDDRALISAGLTKGDAVILSRIDAVTDGMQVRLADEADEVVEGNVAGGGEQ